ncbi:MAG TPA: zinc ribbon domain-containing protein [Planctomycetes bacterium]|nr:zinc ribbon domain-containing protein [Planctomycetota bacterium]
MPTYDYRCEGCGHELELFQSITESPKRKCPSCGKLRLKRVIGPGAGIIFKGSGFYETDYRSESYKKGAAAEKSKAESGEKGSGKTSGKDEKTSGAKGSKKDGSTP